MPSAVMGGGGTSITINTTNNRLPKRSSATAFSDSLLSDDGTNVLLTSGLLQIGGTSGSFPALRNTGATMEVVNANASAYGSLKAGNYYSTDSGQYRVGDAANAGIGLAATALVKVTDGGSGGGGIQLPPKSATPADPTSSSEGNIYIKGGKLVIQYNDGGTVRYKYLDLTGTGATWTHTTTAP